MAALAWHVEWAAIAIILSAGLAYLCQIFSTMAQINAREDIDKVSGVFMAGSILAAVAGGALLLVRI